MAEELADKIWYICIKWDYFARETIGKQMVQAADSISTNLAEGHGRFHFKDRLNFCYFARGSLEETESWLLKAERRGLMQIQNNGIKQLIEVLPKRLNAYIRSIKRTTENVKVNKRNQ
jgi:four helix bundle protein